MAPGPEPTGEAPCLLRQVYAWDAIAPESVLNWLASFNAPEQFYFSGKDTDYELAGLGSAFTVSDMAPKEASRLLSGLWRQHPRALAFGGAAFSGNKPVQGEWSDFGRLRFTVPLVELRRDGRAMRIAFNFVSGPGPLAEKMNEALAGLVRELEKTRRVSPGNAGISLRGEADIPSREDWNAMIMQALGEISRGAIDKVVLSRKRILSAREPWNALDILGRLAEVRDDSFVFLYKVARDRAFLGRTPERLLRLEGRSIAVDALAGTRPRGRDAAEDAALEKELLGSSKELEEHRIVSRYIEAQIGKIARDVQTGPRETILKLKNLQHIFTQHCGVLLNGHSALDTLQCFHPTPAVGGHPAGAAQDLILQWEPHQRGWYAGPIGWMTGRAAEFAVGIRSALAHGKELHLFAGAGIVEKSDPDSEWTETEHKMQTMARVSGEGGLAGKG